jgi:hypothetical protein
MAVELSVIRVGHALPPQEDSWHAFISDAVEIRDMVQLEWIRKLQNYSDLIRINPTTLWLVAQRLSPLRYDHTLYIRVLVKTLVTISDPGRENIWLESGIYFLSLCQRLMIVESNLGRSCGQPSALARIFLRLSKETVALVKLAMKRSLPCLALPLHARSLVVVPFTLNSWGLLLYFPSKLR